LSFLICLKNEGSVAFEKHIPKHKVSAVGVNVRA
jgi:hypothetical protein